ncbi:MAG TPA: tetratricopeptide repeat protein [Anaeromyxobacteraceae bacterium]|nr:tetratricopeptide repeat protein [Anaeromyxobacteraceae bacterium]
MSVLQSFLAELRRRRVIRALVGWGIFSFAVLQIYEPVMHGLHLPEWTLTLVVLALVAGFPATVVLAWIFDLSSSGVTRTAPPETTSGEPPTPGLRGPRLALLLVGLGLVAGTPGFVYLAHRWPRLEVRPAPSVAVLPFADMSPQHDQDYFSDGIAEEIIGSLTRVRGLRVIGRTSSFAFKGRTEDLRAIGRALGATAVLEGSVRKEGNRVRIAAQLVDAADGTHLWSDTFDRELTGAFAIQQEIARAVTESLRLELVPAGGGAGRPAVNPEAHVKYLLGQKLLRSDTTDAARDASDAFESALAIDPTYAPAQAGLSEALYAVYASSILPRLDDILRLERRVRLEAERAVALDPGLADGWRARAAARRDFDLDWDAARSDLERAKTLAPGDPRVVLEIANLDATLGRLDDAIAGLRRVVEVDPLNPGPWHRLGLYLLAKGDLGGAREALARSQQIDPQGVWTSFWQPTASLLAGRGEDARAGYERNPIQGLRLTGLAMAYHSLGRVAESRRAIDDLIACCTAAAAYQVAEAYAWCGDVDEAFRWLEKAHEQRDGGLTFVRYDPLLKRIQGDPRFAAFLSSLKLPPG